MIAPLVHLNGTPAQRLLDAYETAVRSMREALKTLEETAPNARDYYPQGDEAFTQAAREHKDRVQAVREVLGDLEELYENVTEQAEARRR